jgi:hypothetical protein
MLDLKIDIVPGGFESHRRTIATMRIANISNLAEVSDYIVSVAESASSLTGRPATTSTCKGMSHPRRQSVWALIERACAELAESGPGKDLATLISNHQERRRRLR